MGGIKNKLSKLSNNTKSQRGIHGWYKEQTKQTK